MTTDTTAQAELRPGVQPLEGALRIPLGLIEPSPLNPRKRWKAEKVAEMAEDLKAHGQIHALRVRPNPRYAAGNGRPPYEIVVGETRWRAAPAAGLITLDAIVAECTDQRLVQMALSENSKRQDLHPLEEADALDSLLRKPDGLQGYPSVEALAASVGCSPSHVYQRLKLRALCPAGREAFLDGKIDAGVALLIARMPDASEQARATARILAGFGGEPYSYRQAAQFLRQEFMLQLALARFDTASSYKVAGPCSDCNKRSGAAPDLFADVAGAGDLCQDARCFRAKETEAHLQLLQAARDAGRTVLQGAKARAVLPRPDAEPIDHYRLDEPCKALSDSARPLRALLGQGFAGAIVVVDLGEQQAPVELVPADVARKAIKARGLLRDQTADKKSTSPAAKAPPPAKRATAPLSGGAQSEGERGDDKGKGNTVATGAAEGGGEAAPRRLTASQWETERTRLALDALPQLLAETMGEQLRSAEQLSIAGLQLACERLFEPLSAEACAVVWSAMAWDRSDGAPYDALFGRQLRLIAQDTERAGRTLGELLTVLATAEDLSEEKLTPAGLSKRPAYTVLTAYGVLPTAVMHKALAHAADKLPPRGGGKKSAAAAGGREPDATEAFVNAHRAGITAAASGREVKDEASGPAPQQPDTAWPFPKDHI